MSEKMNVYRYGYMILTKKQTHKYTNTQKQTHKYKNGIFYHLLLCFLAKNATVRFISS